MKKGVSVAMIVENEVECIEESINSVYEIADEIVVYLDCHSNDGTREILEKFDKVRIKVNDYDRDIMPFHFGKCRNESLKMAKYEWTIILDGDEKITTPAKDVREFLMHQPLDAVFLCEIKQSMGSMIPVEFTQHRIFPTKKGVYYDKEVHNQIVWDRKRLAEASVPVVFDHIGYGNPEKMKRRLERTKLMIAEVSTKVSEEGGDVEDYYNLLKMNMAVRDYEKAYEWGQEGLGTFMKSQIEIQIGRHRFLLTLARCMMQLGKWEGAKQLLDMHMGLAGEMVDSAFLNFAYHYRQGEFISAFLNGLKYIELIEIERLNPIWFENSLVYQKFVDQKVKMLAILINERLVL